LSSLRLASFSGNLVEFAAGLPLDLQSPIVDLRSQDMASLPFDRSQRLW
jgi:hypothetical protein